MTNIYLCVYYLVLYNSILLSTMPWFATFKYTVVKKIFKHTGQNVNIGAKVKFGNGKRISIGDNSGIGERGYVVCMADVKIGNNVMMGPEVMILTGGHHYTNADKSLIDNENFAKPVEIGDDVWIGARVTILPGVTVGSRVIIGAGSVVSSDIPGNSICYGNPCRKMKDLD